MASISLIRGRWRALIRRRPYREMSMSFDTEREATEWARKVESRMIEGALIQPDKTRLRALIERYIEEHPKLGRTKLMTLKATATGPLGSETLARLTADRIVRYGRERAVSGNTLATELSFVSVVLKHAEHIWGAKLKNAIPAALYALRSAGLVHKSRERDRRPRPEEIAKLKDWFARRCGKPMAEVIDFAVASAMRLSEITGLLWADYDAASGTILVRQRKHPTKKLLNDQRVPLLKAAIEIIERQPRSGARIFPLNPRAISSSWQLACKRTGVTDLHFHDLRHEGASRLFEMGYAIQEVAMFTGHDDWKQLKRYTQIRPETLRRLG